MVTMKDIARLANTSIGTVDRALNNKSGVKKETRQKILQIAESLNYTPNNLGKALGLKKQNIKLGFILEPVNNPYFVELKRGVEQRIVELGHYGVSSYLFVMNFLEEREQLQLMDKMYDLGVSGIALNAINSPGVRDRIDSFVDLGIRVVTCNTDNIASKRSCFVGFENELSGRLAAELLAKFTGGRGKFVVEVGFKFIQAHMDRLKGFTDKIAESYPDISIVKVLESEEDNPTSVINTFNILEAYPDVNGFYLTCFGIEGIVNAIKLKKPEKRIEIICHDLMPPTADYIRQGLVSATICQDPVKHGYMAMKILSEMVINNREPKKQIYLTSTNIKLAENLVSSSEDWEI
ncbi:MAG: LacI family DNA-binding transcriptional regulator [Treponema sp.]|jgi:LacI family transcriptional regulator|nr:LacI family DNA-binding transcriptional regulator [Treponema sp.]